jgi:hypothetical protein
MENLVVTRYLNPKEVGYVGYVEPANRKWILFVTTNGEPVLFSHRDPHTGAVL